jgi:hypothetical protein
MSDMPPEAIFALKHGSNTTDRITPDLLKAIMETLANHGVVYNGDVRYCIPLGVGVDTDPDGEWRLLFDIKGVDGFDHIEFKVTKTGWGKNV